MRRSRLSWILLVLLLGLATVAFASCGLPFRDNPAPTATVTGESGIRGLFVEPDDGREPVISELATATSSVDVFIYLLTDGAVIDELIAAEMRGIPVRVILEQYPFGGTGNPEEVAQRLAQAGVEVKWASHEFSFSHVKTIVIDRSVALIMNLNLSRSSFERNREFGIVTTVPADVRSAQAVFDSDWEGEPISDPGTLVVSPLNSRSSLIHMIESANTSLDIYAEVTRDDEIVERLINAAERGISIRLVMSPDPDPVNQLVLERLQSAGADVRITQDPYVHAKLVIADGTTAFVGSQNFTETSLDENREIGIVVDELEILKRLESIFASDFETGETLALYVAR